MLENMFVGSPPGNYDRLLDFSRAISGSLFFVPTASFLDAVTPDAGPAPAGGEPATGDRPEQAPPRGNGSLGIGSLRKGISHE